MNDVYAADRVADFIGVVKWVLVLFALVAGVFAVIGAIGTASFFGVIALAFAVLGQLLLIWAVFGWFQHTLGMLVNIAANSTPVTALDKKHEV